MPVDVRDVHSRLSVAAVSAVERPESKDELLSLVRRLRGGREQLAVSGERHAMGGQQFSSGNRLLDTRGLNRILSFDAGRGLIEVEAGIHWVDLISGYLELQRDAIETGGRVWGIAQKQTGADRLSLGGALGANIHGRGLLLKPIISDVESFELVTADGDLLRCSRSENAELFRCAIGGYGLFGVIYSLTLRLAPRRKVRRLVRVLDIQEAIPAARRRIEEGFLYGDFQFDIDASSPDFLTKGVFSGYAPVPDSTEMPVEQSDLSPADWKALLHLAHVDKQKAFQRYAQHYIGTDGQLYYSDTHQLATYLEDYHLELDRRLGAARPGSEMITEVYVPREALEEFLRAAGRALVACGVPVIYGTIRLIERDDESFLAWAKDRYACIIFNLHVDHDEPGIARAAAAFRGLIDLALGRGGSFYLTYHRFASREQLLSAYPQLPEFFSLKRRYDPEERFTSDWYRHLSELIRPS